MSTPYNKRNQRERKPYHERERQPYHDQGERGRVCRVCRRILNYIELPDGGTAWTHAAGADHLPDPARPGTLEPILVCDFCSGRDPIWVYPAKAFTLGIDHHSRSVDDWGACTPCHNAIEADDWDTVTESCMKEMRRKLPPQMWKIAERQTRELHRQFRANRMGEAFREE